MSVLAPTDEEMKQFGEVFATRLGEAMESLSGINFQPVSADSDAMRKASTIQARHACIVMISFSGGICGDYAISCEPEEWRPVFKDFVSDSDSFESIFNGFVKESLNMAVGHAINALRDKYPNLTFISPKLITGKLEYPDTYVVKFDLESDFVHKMEGHLAINTMQHEMETTLQKEQKEKSDAVVRAQMMKEVADTLEAEVTRRTRELRIAKERTEVILNSLTEIILTVNRDLGISQEASNSAKEFFGEQLQQKNIVELLYPQENPSVRLERNSFIDFLESAFELLVPEQFDVMVNQAPRSLCYVKQDGDKNHVSRYSVKYSPIIIDGSLDKVVISMRDETEISELRDSLGLSYKKMISSLEHLQNIVLDEANTSSLVAYLEDMIPLAEAVNDGLRHFDLSQLDKLMRLTHTIKGGARSFKLDHIQYFAHEAETILTRLRNKDVQLDPEEYAALAEHAALVAAGLKSLKRLFAKQAPPDHTIVWLSCIENLKKSTKALGYDLDKVVDMDFKSEFVLHGRDLSILNMILPHMIRNSVDHGIEAPQQRKKANKKETGHILLDLEFSNDHWHLRYSDDGRGLNREKIVQTALAKGIVFSGDVVQSPDDLMNILCHPGFSTSHAVTEISGRGVGMDAVRQMLIESGGNIKLVSSSAKGTSFEITWAAQEKNILHQGHACDQEEILLVDDESDFADLMVEIIKLETKQSILCATDGADALRLMKDHKISVIVTDIRMPQMSGWEFLSEIVKSYENVPVVVVSGDSNEHTEERVYELGAAGFIKKPVDVDHFRSVFRKALNHRRRLIAEVEYRHHPTDQDQQIKHSA